MESVIEQLKERIQLVEFIGSYISLKKAGRNFKGICPFHQEKSPSFIVSPERQIWRCFGACGEGGDAIAFYMKWEHLSFPEALKELAEKYHVPYQPTVTSSQTQIHYKNRLLSLMNTTEEFYHYLLTQSTIGKTALQYVQNRGINSQIIKTFRLGYAPSSWNSLVRFLLTKSYAASEIINAGLALQSETGRVYDRFRGRLMFPLKDQRGTTLGFSGRILDTERKEAKYVNSPETQLYQKRKMLFGLYQAKEAIRKENSVILVEGEFDMIMPFQQGISNIVAVKGTSVTTEQLQLIKRYTNTILLALDADTAGEEAIRRTIEVAEPLGLEINIIVIPEGKDPDEAIRTNEKQFKHSIRKPIPVYDFLISLFVKKYSLNNPFSKKKIGESIAPYLLSIQNPIVQSYYLKQLAKLLEVSEESVYKVMYTSRKKRQGTVQKKTISQSTDRSLLLQKYLLELLLHSAKRTEMLSLILPILKANDFTLPSLQKIYTALIIFIQKNTAFDINNFSKALPDELRSVVDELYLHASAELELDTISLQNSIKEIKKNALKHEIQLLLTQESHSKEQEQKLKELQTTIKELEKMRLAV